jgi:hypothetical protein
MTASRHALRASSALVLLALASACASSGAGPKGQGGLYDQTLAGQSKCAAKGNDRPFIIDWDATDQSSFQAHSQNDVVFVHYEGCSLKVLYGCRDDSVKGSFGSYKAIEWTSGGVETIDIHDEGELYAKLPLGALSLSGKVAGGEKLHMEYYVSGTRTATRDKITRGDLAKNPACGTATHFVYAYNLGAFALASASSLKSEVNGSYFGFGGGGSKSSGVAAEKKGGELAICTGDASKESDACKVPIRLALRAIVDGEADATMAAKAPETDAALSLAGQLKATTDAEKKALEHLETAKQKKAAKDGKSCIAELDQHDQLDPRPGGMSTNPNAFVAATLRGECLMISGDCESGKGLYRKAYAAQNGGSATDVEKATENAAMNDCQGGTAGKMSDRDQFIQAIDNLQKGALETKQTPAWCKTYYDVAMKLRKKVKPKDDTDWHVPIQPLGPLTSIAPGCFARAGDCDTAYKVYVEVEETKVKEGMIDEGAAEIAKIKGEKPKPYTLAPPGTLKARFEAMNPQCKK